jgi:hypothetical protein
VKREAAALSAKGPHRSRGRLEPGFHHHIREDFDADKPDALIVVVSDFSTEPRCS